MQVEIFEKTKIIDAELPFVQAKVFNSYLSNLSVDKKYQIYQFRVKINSEIVERNIAIVDENNYLPLDKIIGETENIRKNNRRLRAIALNSLDEISDLPFWKRIFRWRETVKIYSNKIENQNLEY